MLQSGASTRIATIGGVPNTHRIRREIASIREGCPYDGEYRRGWLDACDRVLETIPEDDLELPSIGGSLFGESLQRLLSTPLAERLGAKMGKL